MSSIGGTVPPPAIDQPYTTKDTGFFYASGGNRQRLSTPVAVQRSNPSYAHRYKGADEGVTTLVKSRLEAGSSRLREYHL